MDRANPFADLDDLEIKPKKRDPEVVRQISQIAEDHGFPSRQAQPAPRPAAPEVKDDFEAQAGYPRRGRRFRTPRTEQVNIRANPVDIGRLYRLADEYNVPLGELLRIALDALENKK